MTNSPIVTNTTQQGNSNVAPLGQASQIPLDRMLIRRAFPNNSIFKGNFVCSKQWAQTPFRVTLNAGDLLVRQVEPGGPNQIKGSVGIGQYRFTKIDGAASGDGASGNQHYVYDSSIYIKYKRLKSKECNYNDTSFGGSSKGSYINAIRR